jgi:hypothetical protein
MLLQVRDNSEALGRALDAGYVESTIDYQQNIKTIERNPVYQQIIKDSCGGILYNVANRGKYDTTELLPLWQSMNESEKAAAGGIIRGAMRFMTEVN